MKVIKRDQSIEKFSKTKIRKSLQKTFKSVKVKFCQDCYDEIINNINEAYTVADTDLLDINTIQDIIENTLAKCDLTEVAKSYILYRHERDRIREFVRQKEQFIENYKVAYNTADTTVDDNSNVSNKNIGVLNNEIHKLDNIQINRTMVTNKIHELYPDFDAKQYCRDLNDHIIYKNDESSFACISPYCCSISMYPFLLNGMKELGGLSAKPKNLDSFCGMYVNLIFALSSQFAGAVATSEMLLYFDYFARKEWGDDYIAKIEEQCKNVCCATQRTIKEQIHQYFQQIVYSINQPAAARGMQSAFINFSYFDKPFFEGMFGEFVFPDGTKPIWETLSWLQKEFMMWFNAERQKCILTFPVESFALVYKDGDFVDKDTYQFVCDEYARGHSFFTYISDTVDSLSSCCFNKDQKVLWKDSNGEVRLDTLEDVWKCENKNIRVLHDGGWVDAKPIVLPNHKMYKVVTETNCEYVMTDNHINITLDGEKTTDRLCTDDYLLFNVKPMQGESDRNLTYEEGYIVGAFLKNGEYDDSVCNHNGNCDMKFVCGDGEYDKLKAMLFIAKEQLGDKYSLISPCKQTDEYGTRYIYLESNTVSSFINEWFSCDADIPGKKLNLKCISQSVEFRKGILDGYSVEKPITICVNTKDDCEVLSAIATSVGMVSTVDMVEYADFYKVRIDYPYNIDGVLQSVGGSFVKIKSIDEYAYSDNVFCVECENQSEPYFTLPNGLVTHNCRLKNMVQTKEFSFTNGNIGLMTGSKSVISLNLSRIVQNACKGFDNPQDGLEKDEIYDAITKYLVSVLDRVYKYHNAYNELLWDMYDAKLLPAYNAHFIDLNKQYLTIGLNGLNQAAEFLGIKCNKNKRYAEFCQTIFSTIKEQNKLHKTSKTTFNTEQVPAESLAVKNYNWDKEDGYWVPDDTNLYASYIFKPNDEKISVLDKITLHGKDYIGEYLDGGSAAHLNLEEHLSSEQYDKLLRYAAKVGCQYLTFNIKMYSCNKCGHISNHPIDKCPNCGSDDFTIWTRIIGYLTAVSKWSEGRRTEFGTRVFNDKF